MKNRNMNYFINESNLIERIKYNYSKLSKSQRIIADYILSHYDKAAFMTASKLGEAVDVSESTVVRFAIALGYDGYPKLQKALQELIKTKLTTVQRLELPTSRNNHDTIIKDVMKSDIENIQITLNELNNDAFSTIVETIHRAKKIYVVGFRTTTVLTEYLGFYLNLVLGNVTVVNYGISDVFEQLIRVSNEDVVIGISFPRYSTKTTQILEYVKEKGARLSPLPIVNFSFNRVM